MRFFLKVLSAGLLTTVLAGCSDSNGTTTAPTTGNGSIGPGTNVAVAVTPATTQTVDAGQTVALTATVTGDAAGKGVTWTVSPGGGTLSSYSSLNTTYTAPAAAASATITATSVADSSKLASASIAVNALPNFTATGQLAQGFVGVAYSTTLTSTAGTGPRTYALAPGSTLPGGLALDSATGVLSGTPTATGTSTFSATVTDSAATPAATTASFILGVSALQLNVPALTNTFVGAAYPTTTYTVGFAQGAVTYVVTAGALPAGLTLSAGGVLSGTATVAGTSSFTVTATDSVGQTASAPGRIPVVSALSLTGANLPPTQASSAYTGYTVAATGGTSPYTYALTAGSVLPAGLTLSSSGVISGTATQAGTINFGITVTDGGAAGSTAQTATAQYTLVVAVGPLSFTPTTLPDAIIGSPFSVTFVGAGGVAPYHYSISSGALPPGLLLGQAGTLSGRVATPGTYGFTVEMDDSEAQPMQVFNAYTLNAATALSATPNNAALHGSYAFVFTGQNNGALASNATTNGNVYGADMVGSLTFDGTSAVTGTVDLNSQYAGVQTAVAVTGTYAIGSDHRGKVLLQYSGKVVTLDVALSNFNGAVASRFRFIEADSDNAINVTQVQGSGEANLQTPASFTMASLLGRYVFRIAGETPTPAALQTLLLTQTGTPATPSITSQFGALAAAGYISMGGPTGVIVRGSMDALSFSTTYSQIALTGSFTAPDAHGRGTMSITSVGNSYPAAPTNYIYYIIDAKQLVILSIDPHSTTSLMVGMLYQQQRTLFTTASLSGSLIGSETGVQGGNGTTAFPSVQSTTFYVFHVFSSGTMKAYSADNTGGVSESFDQGPDPLTYQVSDVGRVTFVDGYAPTAQLPVFWLYDINKGVGTELEDTPGPIGTLQLEGQTGGPFTNASVSGQYALGTGPSLAPVAYAAGKLLATPTSPATVMLTQNVNSAGTITNDQTISAPAGTDSSGRFTVGFPSCFDSKITSPAPTFCLDGYILSPTKLVFFNFLNGYTRPFIGIAEQ